MSNALSIKPACNHCGCTEMAPCLVDGEPCAWVIYQGLSELEFLSYARLDLQLGLISSPNGFNALEDLCSNPDCVKKEYDALTRVGNLPSVGQGRTDAH